MVSLRDDVEDTSVLIYVQVERARNLDNRAALATPFLRRWRPDHGKINTKIAILPFTLRDNATINLVVRGRDHHHWLSALLQHSLPADRRDGHVSANASSFAL